ncbi:hypothetical protein C8J57DRAFT_1254983 [Mycena rebaudengoi]|nr:hypothetical protein C8J57DRAFT_1254983 [Mycena rebaudengoi]
MTAMYPDIYIPGPATCSTNSGEDEGHDDRESIPEDHEQQINLDCIQVWAEAVSEERRHMGHIPAVEGEERCSATLLPELRTSVMELQVAAAHSLSRYDNYTKQLRGVFLYNTIMRFQDARNDENFEKSRSWSWRRGSINSRKNDIRIRGFKLRSAAHWRARTMHIAVGPGVSENGLSGERQGSVGVSPAYDLPKKTQVKPPN